MYYFQIGNDLQEKIPTILYRYGDRTYGYTAEASVNQLQPPKMI